MSKVWVSDGKALCQARHQSGQAILELQQIPRDRLQWQQKHTREVKSFYIVNIVIIVNIVNNVSNVNNVNISIPPPQKNHPRRRASSVGCGDDGSLLSLSATAHYCSVMIFTMPMMSLTLIWWSKLTSAFLKKNTEG